MPPRVDSLFPESRSDSAAPSLSLGNNVRDAAVVGLQRPPPPLPQRLRTLNSTNTVFSPNSLAGANDASAAISAKARQLGIDVVECSHAKNLYSPSFPLVDVLLHDDVSIVMRKIVKKIILEKQPLFQSMIEAVRPVDVHDFRHILADVIRHLVATSSGARGNNAATAASNLTWGRIVTAYAFGGLFANDVVARSASTFVLPSFSSTSLESGSDTSSITSLASRSPRNSKELGLIVGEVIDEIAGDWILDQGGWTSFEKQFGTVKYEESLTRKLIYLVGASAATAIGIACLKSIIN